MASLDYSKQGYEDILVTLDGPVLTIVINRAKYRNTFTGRLWAELVNVFDVCDRDDRVHVVILTAEATAPAYCSGADIANGWSELWDKEAEKEGEHAHRDSGGVLAMIIYRCRKVTIAAVNGHAAGVGMTALQLPFDFRFAWAGAKLTFPFVRRGIVPEATSSYLLPKLLGTSRANSLLLTGATVSPDSPYIKDLYHQILPAREAVYPAAKALADELAAHTSQLSIAYAKALIQHPGTRSPDGEEGVASFKERRVPRFTGRLSKDLSVWYPWWRRADVLHRKAKL
ncbi:peroxisomal enoyl-CoA-hydratase [Pholiota molesta]|nr:peroxisomal enoyl-CoA-hydratase [Pholiota molesta]